MNNSYNRLTAAAGGILIIFSAAIMLAVPLKLIDLSGKLWFSIPAETTAVLVSTILVAPAILLVYLGYYRFYAAKMDRR